MASSPLAEAGAVEVAATGAGCATSHVEWTAQSTAATTSLLEGFIGHPEITTGDASAQRGCKLTVNFGASAMPAAPRKAPAAAGGLPGRG